MILTSPFWAFLLYKDYWRLYLLYKRPKYKQVMFSEGRVSCKEDRKSALRCSFLFAQPHTSILFQIHQFKNVNTRWQLLYMCTRMHVHAYMMWKSFSCIILHDFSITVIATPPSSSSSSSSSLPIYLVWWGMLWASLTTSGSIHSCAGMGNT